MTSLTIAPPAGARKTESPSRIELARCALYFVPLKQPASDAKVFTGRQKPLDRVAVLVAWITTSDGVEGFGISYSKRAGGPALLAHAGEVAPELLGEDPSDIGRLWEKLQWAGASVGRDGLAVQAIAAFDVALWDLKAKRAGLSLAKLLGAYRAPYAARTPLAASYQWALRRRSPTRKPRLVLESVASSSRSVIPTLASTWNASLLPASVSVMVFH